MSDGAIKPDQGLDPRGLSAAEAALRLKADGYNELPRPDRRTPLRIIFEVMREPMLILLIGGGLIYLLLGDLKEALILMVFALASVGITVVQETRTEHVLEALRDLTSPRALVIRGGERLRIAGRDVVCGDLIGLEEGDRVPADAKLLKSYDLMLDESLLTGESMPLDKAADQSVFSGSLVVRGSGLAEVTATGAKSKIGEIGQSLNNLQGEAPRLQAETRRLVLIFASLGAVVCLLVVVLYGLWRGTWLEALLAGIALGMSMLPEEFPMVLTVFMAMGAWRISKARVLTRRAAAIESLGSATVLCTDKTGTLTENQMSVVRLYSQTGIIFADGQAVGKDKEADIRELARFGRLASAPDPMEKAFHLFDKAQAPHTEPMNTLIRTYGLRPECLAMSQVWQGKDGAQTIAAKGAPEAIADLCHITGEARIALKLMVETMAGEGLRVLAVARGEYKAATLPESQKEISYAFLGMVGLADPLRKSVPEAVRECLSAGIRVIMITGDYPATAEAIARQAGILKAEDDGQIVSGESLAGMGEPELIEALKTVRVFARILPEQKLRIVNALKARGEIVAMTGDGVNDAPSLKAAHIGIAMGGRGTDVAREASSIVLLDDDFGAIVKSVRLGRRIYDNLKKAMGFIFAVHVPIAGLALMPLLFGLPILFGPVHIAFLEMVIDPVCALVFEAESEEDDVMSRNPRAPDAPLFSSQLIAWSVFQGIVALMAIGGVFLITLAQGIEINQVRTLTFFALVLSVVSLIIVNRAFSASVIKGLARTNKAFGYVLGAVLALLSLTVLWSPARDLFRFGAVEPLTLSLSLGAAGIVLITLEGLKALWHRIPHLYKPRGVG